eukprot:CAMPEP_0175087020 /NCGR_PEP_ID=MMETSP0052_2-20121109/29593_1 /TAXON_ID=51329 ORGANISM="Polytomella parva, Strain SAG 63-3" /NCGR_SAMPLE_ID=MMETSP0052_2 /ASSEMBLY_ACC=CAM_ASM_000194 /LENGTH=115 /DNA_ID=CAMNT_0016359309 /DNA_START=107 /DNA_END=454 /DNA_ORIENTATION=+
MNGVPVSTCACKIRNHNFCAEIVRRARPSCTEGASHVQHVEHIAVPRLQVDGQCATTAALEVHEALSLIEEAEDGDEPLRFRFGSIVDDGSIRANLVDGQTDPAVALRNHRALSK